MRPTTLSTLMTVWFTRVVLVLEVGVTKPPFTKPSVIVKLLAEPDGGRVPAPVAVNPIYAKVAVPRLLVLGNGTDTVFR